MNMALVADMALNLQHSLTHYILKSTCTFFNVIGLLFRVGRHYISILIDTKVHLRICTIMEYVRIYHKNNQN